jgi:hypothetical protein
MRLLRSFLFTAALVASSQMVMADVSPFFRGRDPLTPRDSWGELHRSKMIEETDLVPREAWRFFYYSKSGNQLRKEPAYIGALQEALRRNGYYCGPIDGAFSPELSDAIALMQKNHSMRVTGTITVPVRRALHLP